MGVLVPSVLVIMLIAAFLQSLMDIPLVGHAFAGIRVAVAALIIHTVIVLGKRAVKDIYSLLILVAVFFIATFTAISPIYIIIVASIAGILIRKRGEDAK